MFKVGDKVKVNVLRYKGFQGEIVALEKNKEGFDWATVAIPVYYTAKHKDTVIYKYLTCALTKVDDTKKIGGKK